MTLCVLLCASCTNFFEQFCLFILRKFANNVHFYTFWSPIWFICVFSKDSSNLGEMIQGNARISCWSYNRKYEKHYKSWMVKINADFVTLRPFRWNTVIGVFKKKLMSSPGYASIFVFIKQEVWKFVCSYNIASTDIMGISFIRTVILQVIEQLIVVSQFRVKKYVLSRTQVN